MVCMHKKVYVLTTRISGNVSSVKPPIQEFFQLLLVPRCSHGALHIRWNVLSCIHSFGYMLRKMHFRI